MSTLSPPPLENALTAKELVTTPWKKWLQLLWEKVTNPTNIRDSTRCYARAALTSAQSVGNANYTIIAFTTETDPRGAITGSGTTSFRFTVPTGHGGLYLIAATVTYDTAAGAGINLATVFKNGSEFCRLAERSPGTATKNSTEGTTVLPLVAGDYIDLRSFHDSGASRALTASAMSTHISIVRLVSDL